MVSHRERSKTADSSTETNDDSYVTEAGCAIVAPGSDTDKRRNENISLQRVDICSPARPHFISACPPWYLPTGRQSTRSQVKTLPRVMVGSGRYAYDYGKG